MCNTVVCLQRTTWFWVLTIPFFVEAFALFLFCSFALSNLVVETNVHNFWSSITRVGVNVSHRSGVN
jgi:hypothetical protein